MKKLITIFSITLTLSFLVACSDQVKIQNNLTDKDGRWNIDEMTYSLQFDTITTFLKYENVGEIIFYESGSGIFIQYDTTLLVDVARYFEWENTEGELTLQYADDPAETPETLYTIVTSEKDSVRLRYEDSYDSLGITANVTVELLLKRVDEIDNL